MTLFVHFMFAGVLSFTVYTLQIIPQTVNVGDQLRWWLCIVPTFPVTHAILFTQIGSELIEFRKTADEPELPSETWAFYNLLGDAVILIIHFFFGIIVLILIETDLFACLRRATCRKLPDK